jgi:hypothetical protein
MLKDLRDIQFKQFVVGTLFLPLLLLSFFSVGTMPSFSKQGIEIVICSGDSLQTIIVDKNGQPIEETTHVSCEWSLHIGDLALSHAEIPSSKNPTESSALVENVENTFLPEGLSHNKKARAPPLSV